MAKLTAYEIYKKAQKENLTHEQYKQLLLDNGIIIKKASDGETVDTGENNALLPDVSGSTDDEDEVYYTECSNCERPYDDIDSDFCICSKCGWDANEHRFKVDAKRNPSDLDYLNGDADILSGEWM